MKTLKTLCALLFIGVFLGGLYGTAIAENYFGQQKFRGDTYFERENTFKKNSETTFKEGSTVTFEGTVVGRVSPLNLILNQRQDIWSGGTCSAISATSVPDGWDLYDASNTGATRYGFSDSTVVSAGITEYGAYGQVMYLQSFDATHGTYDEIGYNSAVSIQATYLEQYRGNPVQAGGLVYTDPNTTGATLFIRPYIITCTNTRDTPGVTAFATYGDYATGGVEFLTAVTTVPENATAFEWGWEIKASTGLSGESAFAFGPYLAISDATVLTPPKPMPGEEIFFVNAVAFDSNDPTFDLDAGTSSFNLEDQTGGIVPPNVSALYVGIAYQAGADGDQLQFRADTTTLTGLTFYGLSNSGVSINAHQQWVKCDAAGDFDLYTSSTVNGVSVFVTGAKVR